ncbi:cbb3-type cytochrome oxidase assembly protein CcoS [Paracoccus albus]|uniref:cbb3-type cytochrome oxidase assembly protein CcoS n=1 Tax=Paracoccus albus TaxID=3017784 RepID=UPI0022F0F102|nr:cbb3-type cytochrome oxidase assembly protein CcoS [Paracoccus albus]WBU59194.1 cbb3-type cytochrome oxidase assembly protein CcoS [Paracoccus albus]
MQILFILIPVSLLLGAGGLVAFLWSLKTRQYDDPKGDAERILSDEWDDRPKPPPMDQNKDP